MMKKIASLFIMLSTFCLAPAYAQSHTDRLVAMVEKKPVMESELIERFSINKAIQPAYQNIPFEAVRARIIDEICQEKMNEVLWERVGFNKINPSNEQVQSFKNFYHLEHIADATVAKFFTAKMRENEIARVMVQPSVELTDLEISAFARQKQAWQSLGALWTFNIAFSDSKPNSAPQHYKHFEKASVDKIQPSLFRQIDWKKTGQWQHFKDDGEYVSFYLEEINVPSIALKKYGIELMILQPSAESVSSWEVARSIPMSVKAASELSPELWQALLSLNIGETSEPHAISSQWYKIKLIEINEVEETYENLITSQLKEILRQKKTEEKMPSWYSDMKKNFYIKLIETA